MFRVGFGLLLWIVLCGPSVQAQNNCTIRVRGEVKSINGDVLNHVVIRLNRDKAVETNNNGQFEFRNLCAGSYTLTVTHLGYRALSQPVVLRNDTTLSLSLTPDAIHLQDVEIVRQQQHALTQSTHLLSIQEQQENMGKTLAESLSDISGVSTIGMGNSIVKPIINGLHSNRILILNNGVRQEGQQWGVEHAPEIDPFVGDRLEVVKGAQGVRYGADALGGVVLVSPNPIDTSETFSGKIDAIGQSNGRGGMLHALLEGGTKRIPNLGWRIQASRKKLGNYAAPNYQVGNTGVEELNYSAALSYQHGNKDNFEAFYSHFGTILGIFEGAHVGTVEDIYARIANGRPFEDYAFSYRIDAPRQRVSHDLAKINWKHSFNADRSLEVQYGFQQNHRLEYDVRRVESDDTPMADMVLNTQSLDAIFKEKNSSLGIQFLNQVNNNTPGTGTTPIIPNFDNYTLGIFGIHQFHIGRLHAEAGVRYDFKYLDVAGYRFQRDVVSPDGSIPQYLLTDTRRFHNASGTLGILYHLSPTWSWKSNIGLAWRAPSVNELYSDGLHHGSATYELGNENLESEKGLKWINSLMLQTDKINLTVDAYAQMLYDYIYAQPNPDSVRQTIRGTFPVFAYQQHDALFYGADVRFSYAINKSFQYDINASLVRARNLSLKTYLPYIPADRLQHGLSWKYVGDKQPLSYLKLAHRSVAEQTRYEPNSDYQAPPPAYHLLDLVASKQFDLAADRKLIVLFSVDNLLNNEYKDYMDRLRYYTHQIGRNINLKISYQF